MLFKSYITNDLSKINKSEILKKVSGSTRFSFSFLALLIGSGIVCTLGLLINSTAVVIGGMIISPLMWPLMQTSIGISYGRAEYIKKALIVLVVATSVSLITAMLITFISPIKLLNSEIIARTTPTLIDIVIALVAGGIAALAITQPKISESLAGVAIATSLMPPLCVAGIGLALLNFSVFWGGFLLYLTNIVSIIFIAIIMFLWIGLKKNVEDDFQKRALGVTALILLIISIPLFIILRQVSYSSKAYTIADSILQNEFKKVSEFALVSKINLSIEDEYVLVDAEVLVPENSVISYEVRQQIQEQLESELNRSVDLNLRLQKTISVLSKSDIEYNKTKDMISTSFISSLGEIKPDLTVDTVDIYKNEADSKWIISGILIGDPSIRFNYLEQQLLEQQIEAQSGQEVLLNIDILSRIKVQSQPDELVQLIKQEIFTYLEENYSNLHVSVLDVKTLQNEENAVTKITVEMQATLPADELFETQATLDLKDMLSTLYESEVEFDLQLVRVDNYQL